MARGDEIVESRVWRGGVEVVSRVNWSHVARVRQALGLAGDEYSRALAEHPGARRRVTFAPIRAWAATGSRAA